GRGPEGEGLRHDLRLRRGRPLRQPRRRDPARHPPMDLAGLPAMTAAQSMAPPLLVTSGEGPWFGRASLRDLGRKAVVRTGRTRPITSDVSPIRGHAGGRADARGWRRLGPPVRT